MLGISRGAKDYLVGECKFKKAPFSYSEYLDTLAKLTPLKQKAKFYYALFSENGFDNKIVTAVQIPLHRITDSASNGSVFPVVTEHFSASSDHAFL